MKNSRSFLPRLWKHQSMRVVGLAARLGLGLIVTAQAARAAESPSPEQQHRFLSYDEGLYSESPYLRPGKVDLLYKHRDDPEVDQYNAFIWTPVFKGGGGVIDPDTKHAGPLRPELPSTTYGGGFVRPLAPWPDKGDLILGGQVAETGNASTYEAQGEYRFPFGLGFGGGFVDTGDAGFDVVFGKLTFRQKVGNWNYILEVQGQDNEYRQFSFFSSSVEHETHPGGYVAVYNDQWMGVGGYDGEQWRITGAYIAPEGMKYVRPVIEAVYVDNAIGNIRGPRSLFANASLKYEGGFLSNPARLGRAMGPQGLEFGNPLGFIVPTFNRRLEIWEMGSLGDFRAERIEAPNGDISERYEGCFYPAQFQPHRSFVDGLFIGAAWITSPIKDTPAVIGGLLTKLGFLQLGVGVEQQIDPSATSVVIGLIDRF